MDYLVKGTISPDVIESGTKNAAVIKSHHNVGGLSDYVDFKEIIQPLRDLFKDEVRNLGREIGITQNQICQVAFLIKVTKLICELSLALSCSGTYYE